MFQYKCCTGFYAYLPSGFFAVHTSQPLCELNSTFIQSIIFSLKLMITILQPLPIFASNFNTVFIIYLRRYKCGTNFQVIFLSSHLTSKIVQS